MCNVCTSGNGRTAADVHERTDASVGTNEGPVLDAHRGMKLCACLDICPGVDHYFIAP